MTAAEFLWPVVAVLTWPVGRFRDVGRTYEVALPPSDARAVVRGAIGTDPMYLPVMEGIAASRRSDVVGSVEDDGRLQIYIGSKRASGLGLVGTVSAMGAGSRIEARVGWVGLHRWAEPVLTLVAIGASGAVVFEALRDGDGFLLGLALALAAMLTGGGSSASRRRPRRRGRTSCRRSSRASSRCWRHTCEARRASSRGAARLRASGRAAAARRAGPSAGPAPARPSRRASG